MAEIIDSLRSRHSLIKDVLNKKKSKTLWIFFCLLVVSIIFASLSFTYTFLFISQIIHLDNYSFSNSLIPYINSTKQNLIKIIAFSCCSVIAHLYLVGYGKNHAKSLILTARIFYRSCVFLLFTTFFCVGAAIGVHQMMYHEYLEWYKNFIINQNDGVSSLCLIIYLFFLGFNLLFSFIVFITILNSSIIHAIDRIKVNKEFKEVKDIKIIKITDL